MSTPNKWTWLFISIVVLLVISVLEIIGVLKLLVQILQLKEFATIYGGVITFFLAHYVYEWYRRPILKIVRIDPLAAGGGKCW